MLNSVDVSNYPSVKPQNSSAIHSRFKSSVSHSNIIYDNLRENVMSSRVTDLCALKHLQSDACDNKPVAVQHKDKATHATMNAWAINAFTFLQKLKRQTEIKCHHSCKGRDARPHLQTKQHFNTKEKGEHQYQQSKTSSMERMCVAVEVKTLDKLIEAWPREL